MIIMPPHPLHAVRLGKPRVAGRHERRPEGCGVRVRLVPQRVHASAGQLQAECGPGRERLGLEGAVRVTPSHARTQNQPACLAHLAHVGLLDWCGRMLDSLVCGGGVEVGWGGRSTHTPNDDGVEAGKGDGRRGWPAGATPAGRLRPAPGAADQDSRYVERALQLRLHEKHPDVALHLDHKMP